MAAILKKPSDGNVYTQRIPEREGIIFQFICKEMNKREIITNNAGSPTCATGLYYVKSRKFKRVDIFLFYREMTLIRKK